MDKKELEKKIEILERENICLKNEIEELRKDPLTKTYTRRFLDQCIQEEYNEKLKRRSDWFYNVYLIDLNDLHKVNREKGYEAGDKYITDAIKFLNEKFKNTSYRIFRIGGDEFLIISQPYDYIELYKLQNNSYEICHTMWEPNKQFKSVLKKLDASIIKSKKEKTGNFVPCRNCILSKHPDILEMVLEKEK